MLLLASSRRDHEFEVAREFADPRPREQAKNAPCGRDCGGHATTLTPRTRAADRDPGSATQKRTNNAKPGKAASIVAVVRLARGFRPPMATPRRAHAKQLNTDGTIWRRLIARDPQGGGPPRGCSRSAPPPGSGFGATLSGSLPPSTRHSCRGSRGACGVDQDPLPRAREETRNGSRGPTRRLRRALVGARVTLARAPDGHRSWSTIRR